MDADFAGNWDATEALNDRDTARSRHGYIISYTGYPIVWKSQLQTEITLSSTESEYTCMSHSFRDAILIVELFNEMKTYKFPISGTPPRVKCRVFEDNIVVIEIANTRKYGPRAKHLSNKLYRFSDYVKRKEIEILPIKSENQRAGYLTKTCPPQNLRAIKI